MPQLSGTKSSRSLGQDMPVCSLQAFTKWYDIRSPKMLSEIQKRKNTFKYKRDCESHVNKQICIHGHCSLVSSEKPSRNIKLTSVLTTKSVLSAAP